MDIRHKFYPASEVLKPQPQEDQDNKDNWAEVISVDRRTFIRLAQGMDWLYQNGIHYKGSKRIYHGYNRILGRSNNRYWPVINKKELQRIFSEKCQTEGSYRYLMSKVSSIMEDGTIFLHSIPLCAHVMIMNVLSGNPQNFYALS